MNWLRTCLFVASWALLSTIGCADRPHDAERPKGGPSLGAPTVRWKHKTREEKMGFMAAHVQPTMKRLFVEYDADDFGDFGCETCHGGNADVLDFEMPSNSIYALPADNPMGEAMDYDEEIAQFMAGKVVPAMAQLLSEEPGKGVSCFTCHPKE
jgi:hypothetical protein